MGKERGKDKSGLAFGFRLHFTAILNALNVAAK